MQYAATPADPDLAPRTFESAAIMEHSLTGDSNTGTDQKEESVGSSRFLLLACRCIYFSRTNFEYIQSHFPRSIRPLKTLLSADFAVSPTHWTAQTESIRKTHIVSRFSQRYRIDHPSAKACKRIHARDKRLTYFTTLISSKTTDTLQYANENSR